MCDNRPTEYYRLTVSSVLGDRIRPSKLPTGKLEDDWKSAASVRYSTDMGPVDLMHEGGDWGVLIESFVTGTHTVTVQGTTSDFDAGVPSSTGAMLVSIPELSVGGNYVLEAGDKRMPHVNQITRPAASTLRQGTCVASSCIGAAMHLREDVRATLTTSPAPADPPVATVQSHQSVVRRYLEHPQKHPTRCKCSPMALQSMTVELLDERGNAYNAPWMRATNSPIVSDPGAQEVVKGANEGLDYTMTLLFMRM